MEQEKNETEKLTTGAHHGPILAIIIIMLVVILGGLIIWGKMLVKEKEQAVKDFPVVNNEPETPRAFVDTTILDTTSPSDEVSAIKTDLESTNLDIYGSELQTMDSELEVQ